MTSVNIQIDSQDTGTQTEGRNVGRLAANKVGLLSSIPVPDYLVQAFKYGTGPGMTHADPEIKDYVVQSLQNGKNNLKNNKHCNVIATVGGSVVFEAINQQNNNPVFVSLFGVLPTSTQAADTGNCCGGIAVGGWRSNQARINYLRTKLGCAANEIGLYYNPNSAMSVDEVGDWDRINPPPGTEPSSAIRFSGANTTTKTNDAARFHQDLNVTANYIPARVRAIIVSADPFFQANKNTLVAELNTWATPANRYVCYPLQDYSSGNPTSTKASLYGPNLQSIYRMLGFLAASVIDNQDRGFYIASDTITDV